jgi:hypothetical protein
MLKHALTALALAVPLAAAAQTTTGTTTTGTTTTTTGTTSAAPTTTTAPTPTTTTTTSTTTTSTATVNTTHAEDKLVSEYTKLAGSKENARKLVVALRTGGDAKIGDQTIKTPTDKMGVGNVKIALALTEARLDQKGIEKPTAKQLNTALSDILKMRADGMGWGQIAHKMDMKLGDVMRHDRHEKHEKVERIAKVERPEKHEKLEKPDRIEKPVRFEKPERIERPGK